jgi:hypothetical protein
MLVQWQRIMQRTSTSSDTTSGSAVAGVRVRTCYALCAARTVQKSNHVHVLDTTRTLYESHHLTASEAILVLLVTVYTLLFSQLSAEMYSMLL